MTTTQRVNKPDPCANEGKNEALQASRGPQAEQRPHQQTQIAPGHVNQQTFENPSMPPQVGPTHAAGLIAMSERPLQQFATFAP